MTMRSWWPGIVGAVVAVLMLAGCADTSVLGRADPAATTTTTATATTPAATPTTTTSTGSSIGVDTAALQVPLDEGEDFVAAAPSGRYLLTERLGSLWVRGDAAYRQRRCTAVGAGSESWYPTWNARESRVAVTRVGGGGQTNDSVWELDVDRMTARAITPMDTRLAASPVPFWLDGDRLGYTWAQGSETQLLSVDLQGERRVIVARTDLVVGAVLAYSGGRPVVSGRLQNQQGVFRLDTAGHWELLVGLGLLEQQILAIDPRVGRVLVQQRDVHGTLPVRMIDLSTRVSTDISATGAAAMQMAFSPDSRTLASATVSQAGLELTVRPPTGADAPAVSTTIAVPPSTYLYYGIHWTAGGIVMPTSTDGQPQTIWVFSPQS